MEITEIGEQTEEVIAATSSTVGIAIKNSGNCKHIVKWALEKFTPEGKTQIKLLHVLPKQKMVPTPMGNYIPISQVRDEVALAYRKEMEWQAHSSLLPYKKLCSRHKVDAEIVIVESDDVPAAIQGEITKSNISKLVLGASPRNIFTRKISATQLSSRISASMPSFCTVYVISKGKLFLVKPATTEVDGKADDLVTSKKADDSATEEHIVSDRIVSDISSTSTSCSSSIHSDQAGTDELPKLLHRYPSIHPQRDHTQINKSASYSKYGHSERLLSSYTSLNSEKNHSNYSDELLSSVSDTRTDLSHSSIQDLSLELERLRVKLQYFQEIYEAAQNESPYASPKVPELEIKRITEEIKLKEIKALERNTRSLAMKEKDDREKSELDAEDGEQKEQENTGRMSLDYDYREGDDFYRYTWQEIQDATSSFSDELMIGKGSNGTVYKGKFKHTVAAVKVLHSLEGYGIKQLKQEIKILSKIRHRHLLLLLGACPENGCLIYEYMQNGSLDDRLQCKNNTAPLKWQDRFRIASEVATALAFLHSTKPCPIIHRDLKPANILLDHNLLSKIGDVGLSILLPKINQAMPGGSRDAAPVGTFCYIDPEYQHTGTVSVKSDVYALGVVILQLLTGKSPMGLTSLVEGAVQGGYLIDLLDPKAGKWPIEEATEMALVGLSCAELRQKDRPHLSDTVVPALERLKEHARRAKEDTAPPSHFICPILQELMEDPCVASDGYTYDRKSIERWLLEHDKSPMTNLKLPDKNLLPNNSLRSAILEWKSSRTDKTFGS